MGRPRKNSAVPDARQRIIDSFWSLLQDHHLRTITVGMIVRDARCNRGTFYYHFSDMGDLVYNAIEAELTGDKSVTFEIFNLITGVDSESARLILKGRRAERLSLIIRQGGMDTVDRAVKSIITAMWETVLSPDGGELKPEMHLVIQYTASGLLGLISYLSRERGEEGAASIDDIDMNLVGKLASYTLGVVAEIQGISRDEILTRLRIINSFNRISEQN